MKTYEKTLEGKLKITEVTEKKDIVVTDLVKLHIQRGLIVDQITAFNGFLQGVDENISQAIQLGIVDESIILENQHV